MTDPVGEPDGIAGRRAIVDTVVDRSGSVVIDAARRPDTPKTTNLDEQLTEHGKTDKMKSIAAVMSVGVLAVGVVACGDDDGGGGGGGADEAREELVTALTVEGFDEECIRENVGDLSDEDAQLLSDNLDSEEVPEDASASALAFVETIFECFDLDDVDLGELGE